MTRPRYFAEYWREGKAWGVWDSRQWLFVKDSFYSDEYSTARKAASRYARMLNQKDADDERTGHDLLGPAVAGLPAGGVRGEGVDS